MAVVAGVDGVRGGWVVAVVRPDRPVVWHAADDAAGVLAVTEECAVIAVDIPIGLSDTGSRACDKQARTRLGDARSSVFSAPVRGVLRAADYAEACAISRAETAAGVAIPIQTWGITPKIAEWDAVVDDRVVEVHPELSFRALAPGRVFARKKSAAGVGQRITALLPFVDAATALASAPETASTDDALDALAAAWSARRHAAGDADVLGGEVDPATGRPMRIVV
ncbi:DUF429 domain-containing protein [Actinokineospora sp. PR83]|uniref:DUF429 domain-containing protein n=1 Tax=Actinokineospora sp. PR83 TaxID=2884908 RepID=UPI001F1FDECD|nr:DUF429 domain-containing protein [Actinokineospora sp. PR83]MCG8917092.1 DUF429 domain-containing protein [Actinokineospora sp. PR83]